MNRIIKFRGKSLVDIGNIKKGDWVYGGIAYDTDRVWIDMPYYGQILVDKKTVGQYTGLHDKNGKEIYEGDIIKCKKYIGGNFVDYCIEKGFVEFKDGEFGLHRKQGYYQSLRKFIEYDYELEVISNIYDNPELLGEK